jgi:hypothetical protein
MARAHAGSDGDDRLPLMLTGTCDRQLLREYLRARDGMRIYRT